MKKLISTSLILGLMLTLNAQQTVGLFTQNAGSLDGYVLFAPIRTDTTYLIDKCGKKIHQWSCPKNPGMSVYLLPDGSLLRSEKVMNAAFNGSGSAGGMVERYDWNNILVWSYTISSATEIQNHDICPMPNGNVIVAIWTSYTAAQAIAAGRNPALLGANIWSAKLEEIQPVGATGGNIVWEWNLFDHLVQDFDSTKINYGVVANHPELLNLNFNGTNTTTQVDWTHLNAVTYNPTLDQVMFSSHNLSEIYIIDHSTTLAEAATHSGGTHNKGGDFLYRWGNPQAYNRGTVADRKLFLQHNPTWIPAGYPDADKIMIFNNGVNRPGGNAASVDIISQPVDAFGDYTLVAGQPYGPVATDWSYMAAVPTSFYTPVMGGAQRLINGNTLICEATKGNFFEIDSSNTIVWDYKNPAASTGSVSQGTTTMTNESFRCVFYPVNYSGFTGHTLTPGNPIELNPLPYTCSVTVGVKESAGIESASLQVVNPFLNELIFSTTSELTNAIVTLTDVTGRTIESFSAINLPANTSTSLQLNLNLSPGIYFMNVKSSKFNFTSRLIHLK